MDKPVCWPGWETVREIGKGSFGAVYEIQRDLAGNLEKAAVKVLHIPQSGDNVRELRDNGYNSASITEHFKGWLDDTLKEYALMSRLKGQTNVVCCDDVHYYQQDNGYGWDIYIKMELLTPLTRTLPERIPEETVIRLGMDLCRALSLCRKFKIVHRDIKPQNIFLSESGDYKLGDFGIARTMERTSSGTKIGTYNYMAPEVYNNQPYSAAADIYALGLVLYWLLNERRLPFLPLPPKTPTSSQYEQARQKRFSGEELPPPANGSDRLKRIVLKACAFDPAARYDDPQQMYEELASLPKPSRPVPPGPLDLVLHPPEDEL